MGLMGLIRSPSFVFTEETLNDRDLILQMLKYEDGLIFSEIGANVYQTYTINGYSKTLEPEYAIHRKVLSHFNFNPSDEAVDTYRKIFDRYYHSPTDYDEEVMKSVVYFRENKCLYYTDPIINVGDVIPDCSLYQIDGIKKTSIKESLSNGFNYALIAGFSNS